MQIFYEDNLKWLLFDRGQGWTDSPLTVSDEQDAKKLVKPLSSITFQAAYTRDTCRAFQTAFKMNKRLSEVAIAHT